MSSYLPKAGWAPFELAETVSARYVSMLLVCRLARVIGWHQPISYSDVVARPIDAVLSVLRTENGEPLKRTPRYHYLNALKILNLVRQSQDQKYSLTRSGQELVSMSPDGDSDKLSEETLDFLRIIIRSAPVVRRNFLILFTGDDSSDPWVSGTPIGISPVPGERTYRLCSSHWKGCLDLSVKQTEGIMWGLRQWCQDVGLIDEIFIRPQTGIEAEMANILFPVDMEAAKRLTLADFDTALRRQLSRLQPIYSNTVSISIPLLFYRLCPAERLPLKTAKDWLKLWLQAHPGQAIVEAPTFQVLESGRVRRASSRVVWEKQQAAFLRIGDIVYSRLLVSEV